jgi:hypothetical protein
VSNHKTPRVHYDRDGRARCGRPHGVRLTPDETAVTCDFCLNLLAGVHAIGNRQPDSEHGTRARYRWHLRHEGPPVRCESCLQAERRRSDRARDRDNARRRERYAEARAAGLTSRQASQRKDLRRAA